MRIPDSSILKSNTTTVRCSGAFGLIDLLERLSVYPVGDREKIQRISLHDVDGHPRAGAPLRRRRSIRLFQVALNFGTHLPKALDDRIGIRNSVVPPMLLVVLPSRRHKSFIFGRT